MAEQSPFEPVLPFVGILYIDEDILHSALRRMECIIPDLSRFSPTIAFDYTDYYDREMGGNIKRLWVASSQTADPSELADWKVATNAIERELVASEGRRINIDPGFVGLSKVVLASCKDHPQRIPLKHGVYAEIELTYSHEEWKNTPWTYRDYADVPAKNFLAEQRDYLLELLRRH